MLNVSRSQVGNGDWANWVDAHIPGFTHVNHRKDEVPILPGRFLGYAHPNGEKHIYNSETNWVACSGHDNTDGQCTTGQVGNILEGSAGDHAGPYDGIQMGC